MFFHFSSSPLAYSCSAAMRVWFTIVLEHSLQNLTFDSPPHLWLFICTDTPSESGAVPREDKIQPMHNYLEVSEVSPSRMSLAPSCNTQELCSTKRHIHETTQKVYSLPNCEAAGWRDRRSNRQTGTDRICSEEKEWCIFSWLRWKQCSSRKKFWKIFQEPGGN